MHVHTALILTRVNFLEKNTTFCGLQKKDKIEFVRCLCIVLAPFLGHFVIFSKVTYFLLILKLGMNIHAYILNMQNGITNFIYFIHFTVHHEIGKCN
jgi:hypothetical protein